MPSDPPAASPDTTLTRRWRSSPAAPPLRGFFDVFAWQEPGQVRSAEAKAGPDRIKPTQLRFAELALRLHRLQQFTIIEVAGPSLQVRLP